MALTTYRAGREARATRRVQARESIGAIGRSLRADLRTYRAGYAGGSRREAMITKMDDYVKASELLTLADDLGAIRRRLVTRRCRILYGKHWTSLAEISRADPSSLGSLVALPIAASVRATTGEGPSADDEGRGGLVHRAYSQPPGHALLDRLDRHLAMLGRSF